MVQKVLFALFLPVLQIAIRFRVELRELNRLLELAYLREARRRGYRGVKLQDLLGISERKASQLSKSLREDFFDPGAARELPRRIEFLLWAQPSSVAKIRQILQADKVELNRAMKLLLSEGRIREISGRTTIYEVAQPEALLVDSETKNAIWSRRFDGLHDFLTEIGHCIYNKFFQAGDSGMSRVAVFRVRPQDVSELSAVFANNIYPKLVELEGRVNDSMNAKVVSACYTWAEHLDLEASG